jgi:hypothetical protein
MELFKPSAVEGGDKTIQSIPLLFVYKLSLALNNETSSTPLHMHFHLPKQQENKTDFCQQLALDMQTVTLYYNASHFDISNHNTSAPLACSYS